MYAIFNNIETFNSWHQEIKLKLGFPIIGANVATGEPDFVNITSDYTIPLSINGDSRIVAWVGDETENLNLINKEDEEYVGFFTPTYYIIN